jgi:hypothetical protein
MALAGKTITLELPAVAYPRKVYFPEGAHSVLLIHTTEGLLWTLVEDKQIPYLDDDALARSFATKATYLKSEIYAPDYFHIPLPLCFSYLRIQMRISTLYDSGPPVYRHLNRLAMLHCQLELVRAEIAEYIEAKLAASTL